MATRQKFQLSVIERRNRRFSTEFKQKKVREIESKISTIAEVSRQYEVSTTNVNRWMNKYGSKKNRGLRTIVEAESDTRKIIELKSKIAELERIIGQKQVQIDFKDKMIDLAEESYGVDIKKKFGNKPSSGSGNTESN
jgi:transposase-like protein